MTIPSRDEYPDLGGSAKIKYSFAVQGGAVGSIPLELDLPAGAVITPGSFIDITQGFTSGGSATIALSLVGTGGTQVIRTAGAVAGFGAGILTFGTDHIKVTRNSKLNLVVAVAALTAGVANIYIEYRI